MSDYINLINDLNLLQSELNYTPQDICNYINSHYSVEQKLILIKAYHSNATRYMGDSVVIGVSLFAEYPAALNNVL